MLKTNISIIQKSIIGLIGLGIFFFAIHPVTTFDTFFGLRIGEWIVTHKSIPFQEPFSWSARGRDIIPYEWLAQVWVYFLHSIAGLKALEIYVAAVLVLFFIITFYFFKSVLRRDYLSSLLFSLFLSISIYEFFVARPQIISFVFFILVTFLIFQFIFFQKNYLLWSLPITYIWTNSHASFIMGIFLFFSYALLGGCYYWFKHQKKIAVSLTKTLLFFGVLNIIVTLFPPLWFRPYLLLLNFTKDLKFMTEFVSEWGPLSINPTYQIFFYILVIFSFVASVFFSIKNKLQLRWLLVIPFIFIIFASFQAIRHIPLGTISCVLLLSFFIPNFDLKKSHLYLTLIISLLIITLTIWLGVQKKAPVYETIWKIPSPQIDKDIQNLKKLHLNGRMFNEFAIGGYFVYYLYPEYDVFFDGRADIYSCCEMRDFWPLVLNKRSSMEEFDSVVNSFLNKYQFSFAVIPTYSYNPLEFNTTTLMANKLTDDKNWKLVYVSDFIQVFVKNDGKNKKLFHEGFDAISPYRVSQFKNGKVERALKEYEVMSTINESAIVDNALGELYLKKNNLELAKQKFTNAVLLNPEIGRAYCGLGKVAVLKKDFTTAELNFKKSIQVAPYWGESYYELAKLYHQKDNDENAVSILNAGLEQNLDFLSIQKIVKLLEEIEN